MNEEHPSSLLPTACISSGLLIGIGGYGMRDWLANTMFPWLNENSGAMQVILAGALVIATAVYVWLTNRLAVAADQQRQAGLMPVLVFDFDYSDYAAASLLRVSVRNVGVGPATTVQIRWEPTLLGTAAPLDERIPERMVVGPGESYMLSFRPDAADTALKWGPEPVDGESRSLGTICVSYTDVYGRRGQATTVLVWTENPLQEGWYRTYARLERTTLDLPGHLR